MNKRILGILSKMTLEEKASLCSGKDFWHMSGAERFEIPSVMVTDGPHGLRKQTGRADHVGLNGSVKATCFPPAVTSASGWDRENLYAMGQAIGEECIQEEVALILGPGTNMKRSPLCGRNFEYFSEDPFLSGEMAAAWVNGVQSQGIGTSLKHFAANNQEKARLVSNSVVDERALREIYLTAFEKTVKQAKPWTLMCSYNRINEVYSCENPWLLDDVLRKEWGFDGLVMTDWGAMNDRVKALEAGLELEMPGPCLWNNAKIVQAVQDGTLDEAVLDRAVGRILTLISKSRFGAVLREDTDTKTGDTTESVLQEQNEKTVCYDTEAHHQLARKIAAESAVLLKNEDILPIGKNLNYAVVGAFAQTPRYQGAGSSKINPYRVDSAISALKDAGIDFEYAAGYSLKGDKPEEELLRQAADCAKGKDGVIVFAGLPDEYESEGYDRSHLNMPESHNALIDAVCKVNENIIVVLLCGSPVLMPWRDKVKGIVLAYLGGEAAGSACVDVLTGKVNPSGKLAETFPMCLEDTPCYGNFAGEDKNVEYRESIFIGYRYYDWADKEVLYPFGYGLSYTTFAYSNLAVSWDEMSGTGKVRVDIENTGNREGAETVQIYVGRKNSAVMRAPKELKGFEKIALKPGDKKTVVIPLDRRSFSYYDRENHTWQIEEGSYTIYAASSSRDIKLETELFVAGVNPKENKPYTVERVVKDGRFSASREEFSELFEGEIPLAKVSDHITMNSTLNEVLAHEKGREVVGKLLEEFEAGYEGDEDARRMVMAMMQDMPLRSLAMAGVEGKIIEGIVEKLS